MNTNRFIGLVGSVAMILGTWSIACSSPPPSSDLGSDDNGSSKKAAKDDTEEDAPTTRSKQTTTEETNSAPKPTTAPATADAGTTTPTPTTPPNQDCAKLSSCCGTLDDFGDKLACIGIGLAKNDDVCTAALVVCRAGGVGIGDLFNGDPPPAQP